VVVEEQAQSLLGKVDWRLNRRRVGREEEWKGLGKSEAEWRGRLRNESRQHLPLYILLGGSRARDGTWAPSRSVKLRHHRRHRCGLAVKHGVDGESEVSNNNDCSRTRKSTRGPSRVTKAVVLGLEWVASPWMDCVHRGTVVHRVKASAICTVQSRRVLVR
jgi:hypothetical protein